VAGATQRKLDLPLAVWLVPLGTAAAAVVSWAVWCDSPTAAWIGSACIVATGLLVLSLVLEALPHRPGWRERGRRTAIAAAAGLLAGGAAFFAAALGLYLHCPFF